MRIMLTGTLGFIGSNMIRRVVETHPQHTWIGVDKAVKDYNLDNRFEHDKFHSYLADICDSHIIDRIFDIERPDIVIGMAAESFVDNSITNVLPFLDTNVLGTQTLIDACLKHKVEKYIHISTDEVYGQVKNINDKPWTEDSPLLPRNPYSCSKAAAELVVTASHLTHGLQWQMTRCCNVFGPRQKRENLVPHIIHSLMNNAPIRIHGNGLNFRQYIRVNDKIDAIMKIIEHGEINSVYNIGDDNYFTNLEMVEQISSIMKKDPNITFIEDRKAHDMGYSVDSSKLRNLGWFPKYTFKHNLQDTISWYSKNK